MKKGMVLVVLGLIVFLSGGCATTRSVSYEKRFNEITLGASFEEVTKKLGKGYSTNACWNSEGDEIVTGTYITGSGDEIIFHFLNGFLKEFGKHKMLEASRAWHTNYKQRNKNKEDNEWVNLYNYNPKEEKKGGK